LTVTAVSSPRLASSAGRQKGARFSDKHVKKVLELHGEGLSYRRIGRNLRLSKNTVMQIVQRGQGCGTVML
jgi:hypothetical protein